MNVNFHSNILSNVMKSSTALSSSSELFLCLDYPQRQPPCQLGDCSRSVLHTVPCRHCICHHYDTVRMNTVRWGTLRQQSTQLISVWLLLVLTSMWLVYKLSFRVEMCIQGRQYAYPGVRLQLKLTVSTGNLRTYPSQ